ncbi:Replication factor C subunit 3 [Phytophthora nicotianae]|uniref:Replication factor C subunit 3 n=1 Tax=Phytophthora nicotianae TaxID=4792 RepID=A0A0W8D1C3_PHYNI|nr:Replication factor C subunit 3 [Phytophthora nicotianae]
MAASSRFKAISIDLARGSYHPLCSEKIAVDTFPNLLKLRALALESHHRLEHGVEGSTDFIHTQDVNQLLQFNYLKHQQSIVLERFCVRLKWLPTSHRFHLRQRMLALIHQQKMKNSPRPNVATAYRNSEDHLHCPLFMMSTSHFVAELKSLTQQYSLSIPDVDIRDSVEEYQTLRQSTDECLAAVVSSFPTDNAINTDRELEMNLERLVHTYTRSSRWDLIQRGYLGNCEPNEEPIEDTLIALRNEHKIDPLLVNEWELLTLVDTEYLRVRLEALSKAHRNRAQVDVAAVTSINAVESQQVEETTANDEEDSENLDAKGNNFWNTDALYSLYVLRVSSCRAKRLSLLRLLNYLHFIQFSQSNSLSKSTNSSRQNGSVSDEDAVSKSWNVMKCDKSGDYIITRSSNTAKSDINDEENDNSGDREFIFAAARRDLEVLELQMLRIASIFIFKQEYDSLPTSPRKRSNDKSYSGCESDSVVTPIDRLQVLRDIYDCEVAFLQAKVQLVEILLENGLQSAPRAQDLSELNFTFGAYTDPYADILLPILQRRSYLDFSHAYFFESYAAETILLELQTSLIQQMEQHFKRLEWCSLQEFAVDDECDIDNQWVYRQILGIRALTKLYVQYNDTVTEADEKWFTAASVGEFHALQHALLEQILVIWSLIIKLELPGSPVRCLERTAGDLLVGNGWQLILSPQLLSDACRTLQEQHNGLTLELLAKAIELEDWRQHLAKNVYEANLLERIHNFQFGFVKHVSNWDTVVGGDQARHLAFFFDVGESDRVGSFQPIAMELESSLTAANTGYSLRSDDSKPVSEWLQAQLRLSDENDSQAEDFEPWRHSLLQLQRQYVAYLQVSVKYQDAVGADVFEFAASYPYVCLASSFTTESSDEKSTIAMDLNTVRTKYAKEIADKMTEELKTSCFPYWKQLEILKQRLQERDDIVACGHFLEDECGYPRLLIILNDHLQRLRNEKKLMKQLSAATRAKCAFTVQNDEDQPCKLTKWLLVKLHQLKVDLHIHERPKVEQLLLTPPTSCSSPKRNFDLTHSSSDSDIQVLLDSIPSFHSLLQKFAMITNNDKPSSGTATAQAIRLQEYREKTLRSLVCIFHQFGCILDLLRIRCGCRFGSTRQKTSNTVEGMHSGLSRLERWQTLFHCEIRQFLDLLAHRFSPEAAVSIADLFDAHPEHLQNQHHTSLMRQEMLTALHEASVHSLHILRCTAAFAILQTYQKKSGLHVQKRRQYLMNFRSILTKITMEVTIQDTEWIGNAAFTADMKKFVLAGERALFGEVRPYEREREWQAFEDTVSKYEPKDSESAPTFVVPAAEMSGFLHDVTKKCTTHNKQQLDLYSTSVQQLHDQIEAASLNHQKIENQWEKMKDEERIRREAFAADHAYHLYFEVEALSKQVRVLEANRELDRQVMRCELNAEYEEKLHAMHAELLNKQQKFAEYRATMQRELQTVIQGAHSQFVDQLLDYSGTLPSTTKQSVSHLLRGQQDIVRIKSENAAMKQALLKVQALGDMQLQTQNAAKEREFLLTQRFATADGLLRNEVEQLQIYVKQLEQNLSKLSQEKTYFQVKWTTVQKEMEAIAQRRREEKVRGLSATHNRTESDDLPAISPKIRTVPDSDTESSTDFNTGRTQIATDTIVTKQERQRLETQYLNSTRHYQNEIRRLQQQVTRELREKAAITTQLTQLKQHESTVCIQPEQPLRLQPAPRRSQSASPRTVNNRVAAPPDRTTFKRPSSSFSPRASLLRAQVTVGSSNIPVATARPSTANSGISARKFQVVKRENNALGGVAGVSNTFSVREPLPYR